jgi:AmmeMemoRadiSam system protein B
LNKIRHPTVAGQFYDANEKDLRQTIEKCFTDYRGPGEIPKVKNTKKKIKGIIVPHAGFIFSGSIAAHSYKFLAEHGFADTFIILGPNHTGMGSGVSIMTEGEWMTPFGTTKINEKIAKQLRRDVIHIDENAHKYEHSIEVQLPFLQYLVGNKNFDFVPLCIAMQDIKTSQEVGNILANIIKDSDENIVIIASTDFTHAGFNYNSMPPLGVRVDKYAEKQDKLAIEKILKLDSKGLIDTVEKNNITMCGYGPVASLITAAKKLGSNKAELLKYGTSYEVQPSSSCVGYASLAIY